MRKLLSEWFHRAYEAPEDQGMASFEEVFGRPPEEAFARPDLFATRDEPEDDDAAAAEGDADDDREDGAAPGDDEGTEGEGDGETAPWQAEMEKRFAPGTFTEEGWKAYRNMEIAFSGREAATPAPAAPAADPIPPPRPLLPGSTGEIQTEEQLYQQAQAAPRETAMWALDNRDRLSDEQYQNVMNLWFVSNPHQYTEFREQAMIQAMNDHMNEKFQHETALQVENARDAGIADALREMPLIDQYRVPLGKFMQENPHLNEWVEGLRTAGEVKSAVQSIFYMMAGPELAKQALAQQVETQVAEQQRKAAETAAEADAATQTQSATTTRRSAAPRTAIPGTKLSDDDYAKGVQDRILNPRR